jgi:hypothetical protein
MDFHDGRKLTPPTGEELIDKTMPNIGWLNSRPHSEN